MKKHALEQVNKLGRFRRFRTLPFQVQGKVARSSNAAYGEPWDNLVGFIGCGTMGSNMARNLMKAGQALITYDVEREKSESIANESSSSRAATNINEISAICKAVVSMLPNSEHVESVYSVLIKNCRPGTLLIDCSTISPTTSKSLSKMAADRYIEMIDAPVSGGVPAAKNGSLTFIVGGEEESVRKATPILEKMVSRIIYCGPAGSGSIAKLCNNMILAVSMAGVAEGMSLGTKLGLDPHVLASVLNCSTARCWASESYNPFPGIIDGVPSSHGYSGGFAVNLMEKDLKLALNAARTFGGNFQMAEKVHELYTQLQEQGKGNMDFSVIMELINQVVK